jgi:hypothetical protein
VNVGLSDEFKLVWLENLFDAEKIIDIMETCDKDCANCSKDQKNDCLLEMRESIHSLAIHFKKAILAFVEITGSGLENQKMIEPGKANLYS